MSAERQYVDDGLPPESVRQDTETAALRRQVEVLERQYIRLLKRVSALEGRERV